MHNYVIISSQKYYRNLICINPFTINYFTLWVRDGFSSYFPYKYCHTVFTAY
jgi:hypothetical protein